MPNLNGITATTEETKQVWIQWLGETLDFLENNEGNNYSNNRVFGTDKDDIDEAKNVLGTIFLTLQKNTLIPNDIKAINTVAAICPDCSADLEVDLSTGNLKFIKHNA